MIWGLFSMTIRIIRFFCAAFFIYTHLSMSQASPKYTTAVIDTWSSSLRSSRVVFSEMTEKQATIFSILLRDSSRYEHFQVGIPEFTDRSEMKNFSVTVRNDVNQVIGFLSMSPDDESEHRTYANIRFYVIPDFAEDLAVRQGYRNQGYGALMLRELKHCFINLSGSLQIGPRLISPDYCGYKLKIMLSNFGGILTAASALKIKSIQYSPEHAYSVSDDIQLDLNTGKYSSTLPQAAELKTLLTLSHFIVVFSYHPIQDSVPLIEPRYLALYNLLKNFKKFDDREQRSLLWGKIYAHARVIAKQEYKKPRTSEDMIFKMDL